MNFQVIFRADASVTIGTGHVMRCLTLADALRERGANCHFVTRNLPGHLGTVIAAKGFPLSLLPAPSGPPPDGPPAHAAWAGVSWERDLADTLAVSFPADWLIVDHYALDARWESGVSGRVGRIMVIDDLADRPHDATLLLDQNLGRTARDYSSLVSDNCRRLIGPHFALLRSEFAAHRKAALARREACELKHLMITMGGIDADDATSTVLRAIKRAILPEDMQISIVMGRCAPALDSVRLLAASLPWVTEVLVDVPDMAALMADADLAILAGGSTNWERCCLGLPGIIVLTAENQINSAIAMVQAGAALCAGKFSDSEFSDRLLDAVGQIKVAELRQERSSMAASICKGGGAFRVADAIGLEKWK